MEVASLAEPASGTSFMDVPPFGLSLHSGCHSPELHPRRPPRAQRTGKEGRRRRSRLGSRGRTPEASGVGAGQVLEQGGQRERVG